MSATGPELQAVAPPPCSILIVDDNSSVRQAIRMVLSAWGCVTHEAYNADQAISAATNQRYDLAIIDIGMSGMDGLELCQVFHRDHQENIPLMFILSGYSDPHVRNEASAAGVKAFLQKPLGAQGLREAMENHGLLA
jgi:CheY-like chemotaxis protein